MKNVLDAGQVSSILGVNVMSELRLLFSKYEQAKYISHLDLMHTMQRAFIRANLRIRHTNGFNPHPYMSFALPLPVGQESSCELLDFGLESEIETPILPHLLNRFLPKGITAVQAYNAFTKLSDIKWLSVSGVFTYDYGIPKNGVDRLDNFFSSKSIIVMKKGKKGYTDTDIAPLIHSIDFSVADENHIALNCVISAQNPSLNPSLFLTAINAYEPDFLPNNASFRREEVYFPDFRIFR